MKELRTERQFILWAAKLENEVTGTGWWNWVQERGKTKKEIF